MNRSYNEIRYSFRNFQKNTQIAEHEYLKSVHDSMNLKTDKVKYIISMFPYPSGHVHIGHIRNYTITDIKARGYKMLGNNVFCTMGFDAFGLPAENAAKLRNIQANVWTRQNIEEMSKVFDEFNFYDFGRVTKKLITCDENYYKHQQKFMKYLYERGILYRKKSIVNWDPKEQTVLANEQVIDGKGWRSGVPIEKKQLNQWFIRSSLYAEELLKGLQNLKEWPDSIKMMQQHWIGKSEGCNIVFKCNDGTEITAFTTHPEVIFGCTFVSVGLLSDITATHVYHPYDNRLIPIIRSEHVHEDYATGVVIGCPFTNDKDKEVAIKHNILIVPIIDDNGNMINSNFLNGMSVARARAHMMNVYGKVTNYSLRDWCVSRQRAWGCIIPFIHCDSCGIVSANETVNHPNNIDYTLNGNPLEHCTEWRNVTCPKCGMNAVRETDTMDTFVDSSWYFLRYCCINNDSEMCDEATWNAMPVNIYVGGAEHATMHLIYCRIFTYLICDYYGREHFEPIKCLMNQGMITAPTYKGAVSGLYYHVSEIDTDTNTATYCIDEKFIGETIIKGPCTKMSKSYKNYDDLTTLMNVYGTDALRLFVVSDTPYDQEFLYDTRNITGAVNLLNRIWSIIYSLIHNSNDNENNSKYNVELRIMRKNMYEDFIENKFNNMVANFHKTCNLLQSTVVSKQQYLNTVLFILRWLWCICPSLATQAYEVLAENNLVQYKAIWNEVIDTNFESTTDILFKVYINEATAGEMIFDTIPTEQFVIQKSIEKFHIKSYDRVICNTRSKIVKFVNAVKSSQ